MNEERGELEEWVRAWIALAAAAEDSLEWHANLWAHMQVDELVDEAPDRVWSLIREVLRREPGEAVLAVLAAGPLEELLSREGPRFIDRVEREARDDPRFRWLLGGVWKLGMTDEVWDRVQRVAGPRW